MLKKGVNVDIPVYKDKDSTSVTKLPRNFPCNQGDVGVYNRQK